MLNMRIAVIVGSTRDRRFGGTVANWFAERAKRQAGIEVDMIDLEDVRLPAVLPYDNDAATEAYVQRIAKADGFVMITPEYNHSYPASLKQAIDVAQQEWHAKPVAFLSYGGMGGGIRAVEHLRAVMPEVHATTIRNTISLHNVWSLFDEEGNFSEPERYNESVDAMFQQLIWWARALSEAKVKTPYAA
ncbi:NAD(P)H-dependent oxidoreductase [Nitratireductor sp. ac15]